MCKRLHEYKHGVPDPLQAFGEDYIGEDGKPLCTCIKEHLESLWIETLQWVGIRYKNIAEKIL